MDKLVMQFLGTGAAEGIPSPFCRCRVCENARKVGGKEIRHRSAFRLSEQVMIDFGTDLFSQVTALGQDLYDLEHILITHFHADHWDIGNFLLKPFVAGNNGKKLNVYLVEKQYDMIERGDSLKLYDKDHFFTEKFEPWYNFHQVHFYEPFKMGDYTVTPIMGEHIDIIPQNAANYLIEFPDGFKMLYACDTGYYSDRAFDFLKGQKLDLLIIEATFGSMDRGLTPFSHLDVRGAFSVMDRLYAEEAIRKDTKIYLTHINQEQDWTHEEMVERVGEYRREYHVQVAYDGLIIK